ncbi:MAG: arsenate reductase ArsC [Bacteroidales bacterium]|nr:arsenate reductase ArsC [Bacteroidales bacterium]
MRILILCTGNSCRSQMAAGFLRSFNAGFEVYSGGTKPSSRTNPNAIKVMRELGIDISNSVPRNVDEYVDLDLDYVITVCDHAKEVCPVFQGAVKNRLHIGFDDPLDAVGTPEEILSEYRRVRDEIKRDFTALYQDKLSH